MQQTLIRGVHIVGNERHEHMPEWVDISLRGKVIHAINPAGTEVVEEAGIEIKEIAADNLYCLPGLIDLHVHISSLGERTIRGAADFQAVLRANGLDALRAGVTTLRDLGGMPEVLFPLQKQSRVLASFPNLLIAGPFLTAPGGHPTCQLFGGFEMLHRASTRQLNDPHLAAELVTRLALLGVDCIKVVFTDCLVIPERDRQVPRMSQDVLQAIVENAHLHHLKVVTHTATVDDVRLAVSAGCDSIEHGIVFDPPTAYDDDLIDLMLEHKICYVPTLVAIEKLAPRFLVQAQQNVKRLAEAGVTIGGGSDAGNPGIAFGKSLQRECQLLAEASLSVAHILSTVTTGAAQQLGKQQQLGTIGVGYQADLILLKKNPLEDLRYLEQIVTIFKAGQYLSF